MPDLQSAVALAGFLAGAVEYALVAAVGLLWARTIVAIWRIDRRHLSRPTSAQSGEDVLALLPQHLSIAGLVLAALAIGDAFAPVAPLLVLSLASFVFAWVIGWTPQARQALLGGDALMWTGVATLLGAVFGYAGRVDVLVRLAVLIATVAAFRAAGVSAASHLRDARRRLAETLDD